LGAPGNETTPPSFPLDPLMIETTADRSAAPYNRPHPANRPAWDPKPPTAAATANLINGHESIIADNSDLQYACTFKLNQPTNCTDEVKAMGGACDCFASDAKYSRSLCDGTTQRSAKAYPGVRHLQVLKDFGERGTHNSIVASICPKVTDNPSNPSYGYNPAVAAIVDRLKEALRGKCLPRKLTPDETGKVPCHVIEAAFTTPEKGCNCDAATGRSPASGDISAAVKKQLTDSQYCDSAGTPPCSSYCLCAIQQLPDTDGVNARCKTSTTAPTDVYGYCYIDPELDADTPGEMMAKATAETLVQGCPSTQRRLLRFAGDNVPAKGAIALIACLGATNDEQY
jgi:hypothetical protein